MFKTYDKDAFDPGKEVFENLVLEQTTRSDKRVQSLFGDEFYPIQSRSEDFNRYGLLPVLCA